MTYVALCFKSFCSVRLLFWKKTKKLSLMKQDELNRGSQKTLVFIEINKHSNRCMYSSFFWQNHTSIKFFFELFKKYKNQRSTSPKKIDVTTKKYTNTAVPSAFHFSNWKSLVYIFFNRDKRIAKAVLVL